MSQKEGTMSQFFYRSPVNVSIEPITPNAQRKKAHLRAVQCVPERPALVYYWVTMAVSFCALWLWTPAYARPLAPTSMVVDQTEHVKSMGYTDSRKIVRDTKGNLYIAYRKKYKLHYQTAYHIFVAKSDDNGRTWAILNRNRPIASVGDFNQRVPSIAIDAQDRLHIVWYGPDETTANSDENQIKYAQSTDGGATWSAWRNIASVVGYGGQERWQEHPTIFVSADQQIYVVWEGYDDWYGRAAQIKVTRSSDGGHAWTPWRNIAPTNNSRSRPSLVASGAMLYVFAYGSRGGIQQILYATSPDGGNQWSSWRQVAASNQDQRHVAAAVDNRGSIYLVWRQPPFGAAPEQGQNTQIHYTSFDGATWSSPVRVGSRLGGAQTYPSIAVDAERTVWITWLETTDPYAFPNDAPTTGAVYYVVKSEGGWSKPTLYGVGNTNLYPSLRRDLMTAGQVDVVWLEAQPANSAIRFAQLVRPTEFGPAATSVEEHRAIASPFARIAWALEFDRTPLRALHVDALQQPAQLLHELLAIFILVAVISVYVIVKFVITRWLRLVFR
jgi:hypothetical protein